MNKNVQCCTHTYNLCYNANVTENEIYNRIFVSIQHFPRGANGNNSQLHFYEYYFK